ncbi:hypothetical protein LVV83_01225 [Pseudomonas sp. LM20]|uniref:hypothetical protein n=1 Tax=Pseudomonas sp. LM20 TaxID=2899116 RepID=UPI001F318128|nr:hypothetical protein [Pseudomonas sp. LM20]MCE5985655.1 hypothetical protein [Pseudomonas sp. LM20]
MILPELMQSDIYISLLDDLDKYTPEKIDRKSKVHEAIITLMGKWIQHASLSCEDLQHTILDHRQHLLAYIIKKQAAYTEPNGGKDNIINQAPKVNFPISHIIEYCLLSKRPSELPEYITKIRIPAPRQYAREIEIIFSETKPS